MIFVGLFLILIIIQFISSYEIIEKIPTGNNRIDYLADKHLKEDTFDRLWAYKHTGDIKDVRGDTSNSKKVDEVRGYFNNFNLKQVSREKYGDKIDHGYPEYNINLKNEANYEGISIRIMDSQYIEVIVEIFIEEYNKKDKITKYSNEREHHYFEILDGTVDYNYLDQIIKSIQ